MRLVVMATVDVEVQLNGLEGFINEGVVSVEEIKDA